MEDKSRLQWVEKLTSKYIHGNKDNNIRDLSRLYFFLLNVDKTLNMVDGEIAELGVYKGDTASILANYAEKYDRQLFLFDTFEGFDQRDKVNIDSNRI